MDWCVAVVKPIVKVISTSHASVPKRLSSLYFSFCSCFFFLTSFSFSHSNASAWADLGVKSCAEVRAADFKSEPHMDLEPVFTSDNPKASTYTISSAGVETSAGQGGLLIYTYT